MSTGSDPFDPANLTLDFGKMPAPVPADSGLPPHKAGEDSGLPRHKAGDDSGLPRHKAGDDSGLPRHKAGEWFLKGPIPWNWIELAAKLPGKALLVGLTVWREAARRGKHPTPLNLSTIGLDRSTARRALRALEKAGLVTLESRLGSTTLVMIKRAKEPAPSEEKP